MHPRLAELVDDLARHRAALLAAVAAVPADQLERRPAPDAWTVAEIVDHLAQVEAGSTRLLARRLERAREAGLGPEAQEGSVRDRMSAYRVTDRSEKRVAPEFVRPRPGVGAEEALSAVRDSREQLLALLKEADGLDLGAVRATHGSFGELDLYQWILFIGQHEDRHVRQIDATRALLAADTGGG